VPAIALAATIGIVLGWAAGYGLARRRVELRSLTRRPLGRDGVVIGAQSIEWDAAGPNAALLLHGFGDTPQTLAYIAADLHARGWTVRVPLLPGHGRTIREFARSRAQDWIAAARRELAAIQMRSNVVAVVGLSMGGALATILAAESHGIAALVLVAPYVGMPAWMRAAARVHWLIGAVTPYVRGGGVQSIHDPAERLRNLAYDATTPRLVAELRRVVRTADAALPRVTTPTLVLQSRADNRVASSVAERAFARLGARDKRLVWTTRGGHVVTVDHGRDEVARHVVEWFDAHVPGERMMLRPA
jgi:carboxylesterase